MQLLKSQERYSKHNKILKKNYVKKANEDPKSPKRKGKSGESKLKSNSKECVSEVRVTFDMWQVIKNKKIYDCLFTFCIDGRTYNHSKVSVFGPQEVFEKIKNALCTLKTSSTKYDIACNTFSRTLLIVSLVKKSLWNKIQGCQLPGKFFGAW